MVLNAVTGYYPDDCVFIDYDRIARRRYRLSGEGQFVLTGTRMLFRPACGVVYAEGNDKQMHTGWFVKLGVAVGL